MTLAELLPGAVLEARRRGLAVAGITADSRAVKPGFVFFAVPGPRAEGLAFVPQALSAGASAIVADRRPRSARSGSWRPRARCPTDRMARSRPPTRSRSTATSTLWRAPMSPISRSKPRRTASTSTVLMT